MQKNKINKKINYCFPTIRIGKLFKLCDRLAIENAKKVIDSLKNDCQAYEDMADGVLSKFFQDKYRRKSLEQIKVDEYEGTAIHSPSFSCEIKCGGIIYQLILASTIIVCLFPNRSKAIQSAVEEKLSRMEKSRLARECSKPDPKYEQAIAEEGFSMELYILA